MARSTIVAQDDARENRLVDIFNLVRPANRVRHGTDAILLVDGHELEFELKSVTSAGGSVSTVRDLGPDHIAKWRNKHWIIAKFDGLDLAECRYGTPDDMAAWISKIWEYVRVDFEAADLVPGLVDNSTMHRLLGKKEKYSYDEAKRLQKNQLNSKEYKAMMDAGDGYSEERMLELFRGRVKYLINRGSTLNNPHIPAEYFKSWTLIERDHAAILRETARNWLSTKPPVLMPPNDTP
ncbi:restriction endonuclease PvuII [Azorhizobium sp. AG788]|uniref:hypothetical protein n=1 Tax=Azorhizobium sp. AG788 TaxID=2183897 RepID=UPI0010DAFFE2|nr:hypothetical protein [Azorhizobium sp. AG788]TDT96715.1 restriction endonuclease PvuII [Azorhizobium sp. AG788]